MEGLIQPAKITEELEQRIFYRFVKATYLLLLIFFSIILFAIGWALAGNDSWGEAIKVWIFGFLIIYGGLNVIRETLLYVAYGKKISWDWLLINQENYKKIFQVANQYSKTLPVDISVVAGVAAKIFVEKQKPFVDWKPARLIPNELEATAFCAVTGYSFYIYLSMIRKKFGKEIASIVRQHLIVILNRIDMGDMVNEILSLVESGVKSEGSFLTISKNGVDEFKVAVNILINMKNNPYYISEDKRNNLSYEKFALYCDNADSILTECLIKAKERAIEAFQPYVDTIELKPESIQGLNIREEIFWSENPGCFEKQLQRRYCNPIFRPERRIITQADVDGARQKDLQELNTWKQNIQIFIESLPQTLGFDISNQINGFRDQIDTLTVQAYQVGGEAIHLLKPLLKMREDVIDLWRISIQNDELALKKLSDAQKIHEATTVDFYHPFIMQFLREDSPIVNELAESILCEDCEVIKLFCKVVPDKNKLKSIKDSAVKSIKEMRNRNENMLLVDEKFAILQSFSS